MKKILRMILFSFLIMLSLLVIAIILFLNFAPQFGGDLSAQDLERIENSPNYKEGKFENPYPVKDRFTFSDFFKFFPHLLKGNPNSFPDFNFPVNSLSASDIKNLPDTGTSIIWFGHSALLLKIDGYHILLDPMFGKVPAPASFLAKNRFNDIPAQISDLPFIDAVLISHDHYDHLDHESILKLKDKVGHFFVPLGVSSHLVKWGVDPSKIKEMDWWEEADFNGLQFVSTPAQHFSGRSFGDRNETLWTSWVIKGKKHRIFFSGDSGYFDLFKKVGEKYGPFDITFFECGEYNELWPAVHSFPQQTAQAHLDLKGKVLMPIHWGAFALSKYHNWDEPVTKISKIADEMNIKLTTPMIGEILILDQDLPVSKWWIKQ